MKKAILEVAAVDDESLVGFRRIEPTGPAGERFGLFLPSSKIGLENIAFGELAAIVENNIGFGSKFDYKFSYIHIGEDRFNQDSIDLIVGWINDFPRAPDCRISLPFSLLYGDD